MDDKIRIYSFNPDKSTYGYTLDEVDDRTLTKFNSYLKRLSDLEKKGLYITCMRGFSRGKDNNYFKESDLSKVFVVGEKGRWYIDSQYISRYTEDFNNEEWLISNINDLTKQINSILEEKEKRGHPVKGYICTDDLLNSNNTIEELRYWKVFLSAFLHNIGNVWDGKNESPFVSVTYGQTKVSVANNFALSRNKDEVNNGFIYFAFLETESKYYLYTKKMNKILKDLGIEWYDDVNNEIILLDGLFPHCIIGIFEVFNNTSEKNFILNPWLYKRLKKSMQVINNPHILVNQDNFNEYAKNLGYTRYFQEEPLKHRELFSLKNRKIGSAGEFSK